MFPPRASGGRPVRSRAIAASVIHISSWSHLGAGGTDPRCHPAEMVKSSTNNCLLAHSLPAFVIWNAPPSCTGLSWRTPPVDRGLSARPKKHMSAHFHYTDFKGLTVRIRRSMMDSLECRIQPQEERRAPLLQELHVGRHAGALVNWCIFIPANDWVQAPGRAGDIFLHSACKD